MNLRDMADLLADKNLVNMALEVDMVAIKVKQGEMVEVTGLVTGDANLLKGDVVISGYRTDTKLYVVFTDVTAERSMTNGERFLRAEANWSESDGTEVEEPAVLENYCTLKNGARVFRPVGKGQIISE